MKIKLVLLAISIIFSFLIAEIFIRIFFPLDYASFFTHSSKTWQGGEWLINGGIIPSMQLGYELKPHNYKHSVNSLGMIDKERNINKTTDIFRILVFGDSTTAHSRYIEFLEQKLNNGKHNSLKFEIWNCGVPAYGTTQEVNYIKLKGLKYNPDFIILSFCLNDFDVTPIVLKEGNKMVIYYAGRNRSNFINPFLFIHSQLYRFIISRVGVLVDIKKIPPSHEFPHISKYEYEISYRSLKEIKNLLSSKNIPFLVVILPYLKNYPEEYNVSEKERYQAIVNVCNKLNIDYLDLVGYFKDYPLARYRQRVDDYLHQNDRGDQIYSEAIYNYLICRFNL